MLQKSIEIIQCHVPQPLIPTNVREGKECAVQCYGMSQKDRTQLGMCAEGDVGLCLHPCFEEYRN